MGSIDYKKIIRNTPTDDAMGYLEEEMRIAERDYSRKPDDFIKGIKRCLGQLMKEETERNENSLLPAEFRERIMQLQQLQDAIDYQTGYLAQLFRKDSMSREQYDEQYLSTPRDDSFKSKYTHVHAAVDDLEGSIKNIQDAPPLTRSLSPEEQRFLYGQLVEKGFIDKSEDYQNFCFAFGRTPLNREFKKIKWCVNNKQCLRDLLVEIKFHKTDADMRETAGYYFMDWKGRVMSLPRNKKHNPASFYENLMKEILIEFRKL